MILEQTQVDIGTITRVHGRNGAFVLTFYPGFCAEAYAHISHFFLTQNTLHPLPFFVEQIRVTDKLHAVVRCEEWRSPEQVRPFIGKAISLSKEQILQQTDAHHAALFVGFSVYHVGLYLGEITRVSFGSAHPIAQLRTPTRTLLLPLHDDFIQAVDHAHARLYMQLPHGLVETQ